MYGIFTYIYHKNQLNVGKDTIHGCYGIGANPTNLSILFKVPRCSQTLMVGD